MELVVERLYLEKEKKRHSLALALVDNEGIIRDLSGPWHHYGFTLIDIGRRIDDIVDAFVGLFPAQKSLSESDKFYLPLIERPDGRYLEVVMDSNELGLLITIRDVTEDGLKRQEILHARNQLQLTNAALEKMAQDLGHAMGMVSKYHMVFEQEVRNASQNIQAAIELLRRNSPGLEGNLHFETVSKSSLSLLNALNSILELEKKFSLGKKQRRVVPADLLHELALEYRPLAQMKWLEFEVSIGTGTDLPVDLEPFRLRLILMNLLANAIQFTSVGRISLGVVLERDQHELKFIIEDSGCGFDPSQWEITELNVLHQGPLLEGGTGLGLFICRHLIGSMRGRLQIQSVPGQGSRLSAIFVV